MLLPDGMNLDQELRKEGWCWWYRKYAPGDTVLEGLEKDARDAKKGCGLILTSRRRGSGVLQHCHDHPLQDLFSH